MSDLCGIPAVFFSPLARCSGTDSDAQFLSLTPFDRIQRCVSHFRDLYRPVAIVLPARFNAICIISNLPAGAYQTDHRIVINVLGQVAPLFWFFFLGMT